MPRSDETLLGWARGPRAANEVLPQGLFQLDDAGSRSDMLLTRTRHLVPASNAAT